MYKNNSHITDLTTYQTNLLINLLNLFLSQFTVIVATVLFLRSKNQDELDKKTNNHLPLPLDYASNEGMLSYFNSTFCLYLNKNYINEFEEAQQNIN